MPSDLIDGFRAGFDIFRPKLEHQLRMKELGKKHDHESSESKKAQDAAAELQRKRLEAESEEGDKGRSTQLTLAQIQSGTTVAVTSLREMGLNARQIKEIQQKVLDRNQNKQLTEAQMSLEMYKVVRMDDRFDKDIKAKAKLAENQINSNEKIAEEANKNRKEVAAAGNTSAENIAAGRNQTQRDISDAEIKSREKLTQLQLDQAERIEKMREAGRTWSEIHRELNLNKRQTEQIMAQYKMQKRAHRQETSEREGTAQDKSDLMSQEYGHRRDAQTHLQDLADNALTNQERAEAFERKRALDRMDLTLKMQDPKTPWRERMGIHAQLTAMYNRDQLLQTTATTMAGKGDGEGLAAMGQYLYGNRRDLEQQDLYHSIPPGPVKMSMKRGWETRLNERRPAGYQPHLPMVVPRTEALSAPRPIGGGGFNLHQPNPGPTPLNTPGGRTNLRNRSFEPLVDE